MAYAAPTLVFGAIVLSDTDSGQVAYAENSKRYVTRFWALTPTFSPRGEGDQRPRSIRSVTTDS